MRDNNNNNNNAIQTPWSTQSTKSGFNFENKFQPICLRYILFEIK